MRQQQLGAHAVRAGDEHGVLESRGLEIELAAEATDLAAAGAVKEGITRDYTSFLLILQGMTLQLQGIAIPPF